MNIDDSAEKITIEIDLDYKSPEIDKKKLIYGSPEANRSRRTWKDRRIFEYTAYIPERRSGIDRRDSDWYRNWKK